MEKPVFNVEDGRISNWLELRPLQLELLYTIYCLELGEQDTSPKNIRIKFNILFNRDIARQNVFSQVRALIEKGYVIKEGKKIHKTDFETIAMALKQKSKEYSEESDRINQFAKDIKNQFKRISGKNPKPKTEYLGKNECLDIITEHIPHMKNIYIITPRFPNIAYNNRISKNLKRTGYHKALREHLKKRGNQLFYLTALNMETTYNRALQVTKNPSKAYKDTCRMMDDLCEFEARNPGLKVRYWEYAYATHVFILENPTHGEVVITIEGTTESTKIADKPMVKDFPGVFIKSKEVSDKAKQNFFDSWEQGTDINTKKSEKIIQQKKEELHTKIFQQNKQS